MNFHDGFYQAQNHSAIQQTPESDKGESQRVMQKLALAIRDLGDATTIIAIVPLKRSKKALLRASCGTRCATLTYNGHPRKMSCTILDIWKISTRY
jgi:hypothetical protein